MNVGTWNADVIVDGMPEEIATAFAELGSQLIGAEYTPIAYLGKQLVNGTNYAILAEQTILAGKDTKNIVLLIFNAKERAGQLPEVTLVNIERVLEGGAAFGGVAIDVQTEIPAEAKAALDSVLTTFVGSTVKPFALLASQVVKGINYVFAATVAPSTQDPVDEVCLVTVNAMENKIAFADILGTKEEVSLGKPLGEWP